jgi:ElaB/YqjD/DUF883 family membrane-anchored ribosome-binding protein
MTNSKTTAELIAALHEAKNELKLVNDDMEALLERGDASWEECEPLLDKQEVAMKHAQALADLADGALAA